MARQAKAATRHSPPGRHPGTEVVAAGLPDPAGEARRDTRAHHVRGEHPAEDDAGALQAEVGPAQRDGRRDGGHPVQAVEHDEHPQRRGDHRPEQPRHDQQRHPAEPVVDEQQQPGVDPVGEPARPDRADDVEDADHREQAGRGRRRHPVVVGRRDEVRPDQPVRRPAADPEGADQDPERPGARALDQRPHRQPTGRAGLRGRVLDDGRRTDGAGAVADGDAAGAGATAPYGVVPTAAGLSATTSSTSGTSSAVATVTTSAAARQPGPAASATITGRNTSWPVGVGRREDPGDQPALGSSNQRLATMAPNTRAMDPVPTPTATPQSSHSCQAAVMKIGEGAGDADQGQGDRHDPADAEPLHQRRGERRGQPVDDQVQRHRARGGGAATTRTRPPAARAARRSRSGTRPRRRQRAEGHRRDEPGAVDARPACGTVPGSSCPTT